MRNWRTILNIKKDEIPKTLLPIVPSQTTIWFSKNADSFKWDSAQSLDENSIPTIELNLQLVVREQKGKLAESIFQVSQLWIAQQVMLECRQLLKERNVQEDVSHEAEYRLNQALQVTVAEGPRILRYYTNRSIQNILRGNWNLDEDIPNSYPKILRLLKAWLEAGTDLVYLQDALFLQGVLDSEAGKRAEPIDESEEETE